MPDKGELRDPGQQQVPGPGDVAAGRPPALSRLEALAGEWTMEASFEAGYSGPGSPPATDGSGHATFEWLEGKFFLIQRVTMENPAAPDSLAIIGAERGLDRFSQHYYDSRGVERVYMMSLDEGVWKLWREAPGFWQRFTGVFSADGTTIEGTWEMSPDGSEWKHDFRLTYTKVV
jgi:hypothetical protein